MTNLNLIFFNISKELQVIAELNKHYSQQENFDVEFIVNPAKVSQFIQTTGNGIVIFKVASKGDLQIAVDFLRNQKKAIKRGLVKPACILMVKNKKVEKILPKYGCQELLDENINSKTLRYKIDFWARNLRSQLDKIEKEKENRQKAKSPGSTSKNEKDYGKKQEFVSAPALELQSDTWLIKNKSDAKKILKRYLVKVLGPSPHIGQWFELEPLPGDTMPTWKYLLRNEDEQKFVVDEGACYFSGSKPEFDWKVNRWNFSSDAPHLYFYNTHGEVYSRFKFKEGKVEVAENSNYALTKEEMILETCDAKFNFDADKAAKEEEAKLDGEDVRDDLLSGRNKDGSVDEFGGNLSGKVKKNSEESKKSTKFEEVEGEGSQKDREGVAEGDQGGHYVGKGSTDEIEDGPLSGKLKPGQVKAKEGKDREGFEEGDQGGHYGGKGSTDEIEDGPLSGKLKPGQVKAKEDKDHEGVDEGDLGEHYGGEGSTDQIDADPLSGKLKPGEQAKKENRKSKFEEENQGGHYDNEGSTDEVDRSPLKGKLKAKDHFAEDKDLDSDADLIAPKKKKSIERNPVNQDDNAREIDSPQLGQVRADESHPDGVAARDAVEKLKKKQEALKKAGLSDEDLNIDELDRDGLDKLIKKRQEALKAAGLLEEGDDVSDLAKPEPAALKGLKEKSPVPARKEADDLSVEELDRDGADALSKKGTQQIGVDPDEDELLDDALAQVTRPKDKQAHTPKTGVEEDQAKVDAIIGEVDILGDEEPDFDGLIPKNKSKSVDVKSQDDDETGELNNKKEVSLDDAMNDGNATEELSSKKAKEMAEALDAVASNVTDIKDAIIDNKAKEEADKLDPNQIIDNADSREELKEIFEKEIPISIESGELNVVIESPEENVAHICKFEDFHSTEIVVVIEAGKLSQDKDYDVKVHLKYADSKIEIEQKAKVVDIDDFEDGKVLVCLEFIQEIDEKEFNTFSALYQERQKILVIL